MVGLLTLASCASGTPPTSSSTPSSTAAASASVTGAVESATPPAAPTDQGGPATVVVDQLRVRTEPGVDEPQVTFPYGDNNVVVVETLELNDGLLVWILNEAPVVRDGYEWRKIAVNNFLYNDGSVLAGWVAQAAANGTAWLAPFSKTACPVIRDATIAQPDLDRLRWMSLLGPACFGNDSISFAAYWPELIPGTGPGSICAGPEPRWLLCNPSYYTHVNVTADTSQAFPVHAPDAEAQLGERGHWLLLTGHFDDPAAQECAGAAGPEDSPEALVMFCRTRFVLEFATPIEPPA